MHLVYNFEVWLSRTEEGREVADSSVDCCMLLLLRARANIWPA